MATEPCQKVTTLNLSDLPFSLDTTALSKLTALRPPTALLVTCHALPPPSKTPGCKRKSPGETARAPIGAVGGHAVVSRRSKSAVVGRIRIHAGQGARHGRPHRQPRRKPQRRRAARDRRRRGARFARRGEPWRVLNRASTRRCSKRRRPQRRRPTSISWRWAESRRVLGHSSRLGGPYRVIRTPFWREPMEALSPRSGVQTVVIEKAAQMGARKSA